MVCDQIALFTWGVRHLRSVLQRCQKRKELAIDVPAPPLFASLSPMAVKKLVELDPTTYHLIDVRPAGRAEPSKIFKKAINIPGTIPHHCPSFNLNLPTARMNVATGCLHMQKRK